MTDPTGTPPAAPGDPAAPAPAPAAEPAKSGGKGKLIGTIILVLIVAGFAVYRFVLPAIEQSKFEIGACVDYYPQATSETNIDPKVVDCSDPSVKSEIVKIIEGSDVNDCLPEAEAYIQVNDSSKSYCIAER